LLADRGIAYELMHSNAAGDIECKVLAAASAGAQRIIVAGVGLMFIVLGNYMGKVRKNFFIGIRTPWTLASDEVWSRTHRLGGKVFVLTGIFMIVNIFVRFPGQTLVVAIVAAALIPVIYSYVICRRIEGFSTDADDDPMDESAPD
jgi:uncharacterized membrane protein